MVGRDPMQFDQLKRREFITLLAVRICPERKMVGAAQAGRTERHTRGRHSGSCHNRWHRSVRRHPVRGTVVGRGGEPGQRARPGRDRTRCRGLPARTALGQIRRLPRRSNGVRFTLISGHKKRETAAMSPNLMRRSIRAPTRRVHAVRSGNSIPRSTVFLRQQRPDLVCTGRGVLRGWGAPKVDGLTDVELMGCH